MAGLWIFANRRFEHRRTALIVTQHPVDQATGPLVGRGIIAVAGDRYRPRERQVLRYYGRSLNHLLRDRGGSKRTR